MNKCHVVVQTAFIGDLFLAIPALVRLKRKNPEHKIILVCKKGLKDFFIKNQLVDLAFEVEKGSSKSYSQAADEINQHQVDTVFCFHQSIRSTLFSFKIRAQNRIGFRTKFFLSFWKKIFFKHLVIYTKSWPDVIRQMALLSPTDPELAISLQKNDWSYLNIKNAEGRFPEIPNDFKFPVLALSLKKSAQSKKVALFPGSVWATKKWTHVGFAEVANLLIADGYEVSIMGAPSDRKDSTSVKGLSPNSIDLTGQMSLHESAMALQDFDLIICNDSAPAHMAASLQRPVLCIFGPTVLDFGFRPWNDKSQVVEHETLKCRPCGPHGHVKCPLSHHDCMNKIEVINVYKAAVEILTQEKI